MARLAKYILCILTICFVSISVFAETDSEGRKIINGPVFGDYYSNVHIISDSVGVYAQGSVTIRNSVIEAKTCVKSAGIGLNLQNNTLICGLCVEFTGSMLMDNTLSNNNCSGRGTNRPDQFGW